MLPPAGRRSGRSSVCAGDALAGREPDSTPAAAPLAVPSSRPRRVQEDWLDELHTTGLRAKAEAATRSGGRAAPAPAPRAGRIAARRGSLQPAGCGIEGAGKLFSTRRRGCSAPLGTKHSSASPVAAIGIAIVFQLV